MKTYRAKFTGRKINAIGMMFPYIIEIKGHNEKTTIMNLYNKYEHITSLELDCIFDDEISATKWEILQQNNFFT